MDGMPVEAGWGVKVNEMSPLLSLVKASEIAAARASHLVETTTLRNLICESSLVRRGLVEMAEEMIVGSSQRRMAGAGVVLPLRSEAARAAV